MNRPVKALAYTAESLIDFIYPAVCFVCRERIPLEHRIICPDCWEKLPRNTHNVLASGDKAISAGKRWFSFVAWRFVYSDEMRELIHHFKFNGFSRLRYPLGSEMSETVLGHQELNTADMIIAVPLHRARLRERGYNQSLLLARSVSEHTHIPVIEVLERIKNTLPQATFETAEDKIWNVRGIFTVKNPKTVQGKRIILVDDIFTTGATANECSKTLAGAGAREIMVVTAAYAG